MNMQMTLPHLSWGVFLWSCAICPLVSSSFFKEADLPTPTPHDICLHREERTNGFWTDGNIKLNLKQKLHHVKGFFPGIPREFRWHRHTCTYEQESLIQHSQTKKIGDKTISDSWTDVFNFIYSLLTFLWLLYSRHSSDEINNMKYVGLSSILVSRLLSRQTQARTGYMYEAEPSEQTTVLDVFTPILCCNLMFYEPSPSG